MKKIILIAAMFASPSYAVTNLEFARANAQEKPLYGEIKFAMSGENGNKESQKTETGGVLSFSDEKNHYMGIVEHVWQERDGEVYKNQGFMHLRYTRVLSKTETGSDNFEMFVQGRRDKFLDLESRRLAGAGYRKRFYNSVEKYSNAFGVGAFYETEEATANLDNEKNTDWRFNAYWHFKSTAIERLTIENVLYLQPSLKSSDDYRVHDEIRATNHFTEHFSIGFSVVYSYDSEPLGDIDNYDLSYGSFAKYMF